MRFFIPNFLTLSNLIIGFICIINIINQSNDFPILILFYACLFLDFLDGFLARKLKTTSEFGKQLDSLADLVSFALLPALILYYHLENISDNILLKYISIFIVLFSAIRLAKFNISKKGDAFFEGLPTPANAIFFMSLLYYDGNLNKYLTSEVFLILTILFSMLLVSRFKFISFKFSTFNFKNNLDRYIIILFATISFILFGHSILFITVLFYVFYSISKSIFSKLFFK